MLSYLFWCAVRYGFDACFCVRYFLCLNGKELFQEFDGKLQIWNGTADATHWKCVPVTVSFKISNFLSAAGRWRVVNYLLPFYCHYHWVLTLSSALNTSIEMTNEENDMHILSKILQSLKSCILDCFMVSEPMGCFFQCISYQECYSVNFASVS